MIDSSKDKLIESLYNVTVYPERHDELMQLWQAEFLDNSDASLDDDDSYEIRHKAEDKGHISSVLEQHCYRAFTILDMVSNRGMIPTLKQMVDADPMPAFIVSTENEIVLANEVAQNRLQINTDSHPIGKLFSVENSQKIAGILAKLDGYETNIVLSVVQAEQVQGENIAIFGLSKIYDSNTDLSFLQFSAISLEWEDKIGKIIRETFLLSDAELDIARRLVAGQTLPDIADEKQRSLLTVKTQTKAVFRKMRINSQTDLIRLFVALLSFDNREKNFAIDYEDRPATSILSQKQEHFVMRPNGRKLYYEIHGDPSGTPVLFMHGMFSGTKFPAKILKLLNDKKLKFIAPHRAGYGHSDVCEDPDKMATFVADMTALLDQEELQKIKIFAHQNGSYYTYWLSQYVADRMEKIRIVNGVVPFASSKFIHQMNARQRIISYTAKYTPKLLPFMFKSAIAQIQKDGGLSMMEALYSNSEHDYALCQNPETRDLILHGFQTCISQGVESLINDTSRVFGGNWEYLIDQCTVPVEIFHATNDPTVPVTQILETYDKYERYNVTVKPAGGYLFYTRADEILEDF